MLMKARTHRGNRRGIHNFTTHGCNWSPLTTLGGIVNPYYSGLYGRVLAVTTWSENFIPLGAYEYDAWRLQLKALGRNTTIGRNLGPEASNLSSSKLVHARIIAIIHEVIYLDRSIEQLLW